MFYKKKKIKLMKTQFRNGVFFVIIFFIMINCSKQPEFNGKFSFYPENPKPGEEVTIMYVSDSTNLAGAESVEMVVHLYNDDLDSTYGIEMSREGVGWKAKFNSNEKHFGALLRFRNEDKSDNNNKEGYFVYFYKRANQPIPGAFAGAATAISSWGAFYADLERNRERAFELFKKEFEINPEVQRNFISQYLLTLNTLFPGKSDSLYQTLAETTEQYPDLNEKEINLLITFYGMTKFYNQEKVDKYIGIMKEKFPAGEYMQNDFINRMRTETNVNNKIQMAKEFEVKFPDSKFKNVPFDLVVNGYRDVKDYDGAYEYLKTNMHQVSPMRFYYLVTRMLEEKADLKTALKIAELGVQQNKKHLSNQNSVRENYETENDFKEMKKTALAYSLFAAGKVLREMKNYAEALNSFEEMIKISERKNPEMNEFYAQALVENERYQKAMNEIEHFLRAGKHTPPMKELLKTAYMKVKGSDSGFDNYISEFEALAKEILVDKLKEELISRPAPQFTLKDLNGNNVSLSDYRGKTVIVDFWATWCGPCLSSFPGMQQAVNKFAGDNEVKFLFINTWERVDDKVKNASDFINKNNYTFHVLMDEENKVVTDYKVTGIPTKFIIDKEQNIRFVSIGYEGTPEGLVEELSAMIEMVR